MIDVTLAVHLAEATDCKRACRRGSQADRECRL